MKQNNARYTHNFDETAVKFNTNEEFIKELQKITNDERVLKFMNQLPEVKTANNEELNKLLEEYEQ
jgi:predicted transcriptional regulator